jgi:hypothetical protein
MREPWKEQRPARRRDVGGQWQVAPAWETLIERQIREAAEAGEFDNLPFQGEPIPNDDNPLAGEWGLAFRVLKNAGVAPPWIEADKEVRLLLDRRDAIIARASSGPAPTSMAQRRDCVALADIVADANAAIARVNVEAPTDRQRRHPLRLADELARYDEACRR